MNTALLKTVLADLAKLKNKTTSAAVVAFATTAVLPLFGVHVGALAESLTGALAAIGVVASALETQVKLNRQAARAARRK